MSTAVRLTSPGADLVLTAVGGDPVVLDRDNSRLRWLRRDQTVQIDAGAEAVLQQPDPTGTCAHVLAGGQLGCYGPDGLKSAMPMTLPAGTWAAAQLFASGKNAVVTWPGRETVVIADWRTEETTENARPEPSA